MKYLQRNDAFFATFLQRSRNRQGGRRNRQERPVQGEQAGVKKGLTPAAVMALAVVTAMVVMVMVVNAAAQAGKRKQQAQ